MQSEITQEKLKKYFLVAEKALLLAEKSGNKTSLVKEREDFLDMIRRYISDAKHFREQGNYVLALAAINYAHAWLDAGVRIGLFRVKDNELFASD